MKVKTGAGRSLLATKLSDVDGGLSIKHIEIYGIIQNIKMASRQQDAIGKEPSEARVLNGFVFFRTSRRPQTLKLDTPAALR